MSKYIIEFDDKQLLEYDKDTDTHFRTLYKAKGFNALVFDKEGLNKLTPLDKELDEAYQKGFEVGSHEATTLDYQCGLDDAWECARKICLDKEDGGISNGELLEIFKVGSDYSALKKYSASEAIAMLREYEQQKVDAEIKVGDIITDGKINYLVIDITDKSYVALQGTDFEPAYIGKDYIKSYHNLHDSKDMQMIAKEINKAVKSEQQERLCISCKHCNSPDTMRCMRCRKYDGWEPKEGAE